MSADEMSTDKANAHEMSTDKLSAHEMSADAPTRQPTTSDRLVAVVTAVPGVSAIEPGIATTIGAIDARLRHSPERHARFGLFVDGEAGAATVEVALDGTRPVREVVADVQRAVAAAATETGASGKPLQVHVRVQSLTMSPVTHD